MLNQIRAASAALVVAALATAASAGGGKAAAKATAIPGEDDFRSATGYTVALMEHCKAINKLARGKGAFNAELAREHAEELSRNATSASRHRQGYASALGAGQRSQVSAELTTQETSEGAMMRYASALDDALKGASPDRKAVADTVTDLYLAAKDFLTAQKSAGKTLGIRAATPPRKAAPRKPRIKKGDEVIGEVKP
jgi:hypothetical protein